MGILGPGGGRKPGKPETAKPPLKASIPFLVEVLAREILKSSLCARCHGHHGDTNHRPCFEVGCHCSCSHIPGYIA